MSRRIYLLTITWLKAIATAVFITLLVVSQTAFSYAQDQYVNKFLFNNECNYFALKEKSGCESQSYAFDSSRLEVPLGNSTDIVYQNNDNFNLATVSSDLSKIKWEIAGIVGGAALLGVVSWNWGSGDFRFQSEGFFDSSTGSMGMDKLGHAYSTYVMTEFLTHRIERANGSKYAPYTAALVSSSVMLGVEVLDGFSKDHGFAYEDLIFNSLGAGFSVLRSTVPGLKEKLDFRMEYLPSGNKKGFHPITDYSGQKYLFALKFAGFENLKKTPLRFLELQVGYFARGITKNERLHGIKKQSHGFVGIGLNVAELFRSSPEFSESNVGEALSTTSEYLQVPYSYVRSDF